MNRTALLVALFFINHAGARDTKQTCLIAAEIRAPGPAPDGRGAGRSLERQVLSATAIRRGWSRGSGFFLKDVPEREFRVTNVRSRSRPRSPGVPERPGRRFDTLGIADAGSDRGDIAHELPGACKGGAMGKGPEGMMDAECPAEDHRRG